MVRQAVGFELHLDLNAERAVLIGFIATYKRPIRIALREGPLDHLEWQLICKSASIRTRASRELGR
jgi:hypothetical protein